MGTPIIVATPQSNAKGAASSSLVEFVDIDPTLADLAQIEAPAYLEGQSFAPILDNPQAIVRNSAFSQQRGRAHRTRPGWGGRELKGYSPRTDDYRYTEWNGGRHGVQLYDFNRDPGEFDNVAGQPDYAAAESELREMLQERKRQGSIEPRL